MGSTTCNHASAVTQVGFVCRENSLYATKNCSSCALCHWKLEFELHAIGCIFLCVICHFFDFFYVLHVIDCIFLVFYAIKNVIEHIKKYNLWHRAQIVIFNDVEHMSYNFLWHTRNFLIKQPLRCKVTRFWSMRILYRNKIEELINNKE
jgi:hypothetical protein